MFLSEVLRVDIEASRAGDICGQVAYQLSIYNPETHLQSTEMVRIRAPCLD